MKIFINSGKVSIVKNNIALVFGILLMFINQTVVSYLCSGSISATSAITSTHNTFDITRSSTLYSIKSGSASNSNYFLFLINDISATAIRKVSSNGAQNWITSYSFTPAVKSLAIDPTEQYLYFVDIGSPICVVRLQTSDGSLFSVNDFSGVLNSNADDFHVHVLSDSSGYFILGLKISKPSSDYICKYLHSSSNAQCQEVTSVDSNVFAPLVWNNDQIFFIGLDSIKEAMHFYKITFGSSSVDWAKQMLCTSVCSLSSSEALLNSDNSQIYSFSTYGMEPSFVYFVTFYVSDGSVVGSKYASSISCSAVYGSVLSGSYLVATLYCSDPFILIFNTALSTFLIEKLSGYNLYCLSVDSQSGRVMVGGDDNTNAYFTEFYPSSLPAHPDFSTSGSLQMNALSTGTNDIIAETSATINSLTSNAVSSLSIPKAISTNYQVVGSPYISDVYFQISDQSFSIIENYSTSVSPSLSCSSSGSTSISFSLAGYNTASVPSWITINSSLGSLTVVTPDISVNTGYSFYINAGLSGVSSPVQKIITLMVEACSITNCETCSTSSICSKCSTGYILNSGKCISKANASTAAKTLTICIQAITGFALITIIMSSIMKLFKLTCMWSIINQAQLFLLLLVSRAYIPIDVQTVIKGLKIAINPADYFSFQNIEIYNSITSHFDYSLSDTMFEDVDIQSDNTIFNISSLLTTIIYAICIHFLIILLRKLFSCIKSEGKCSSLIKVLKSVISHFYITLTFGYYIRVILETNEYLLFSSIYESYNFHTSEPLERFSLAVAILIIFSCIILIVIVTILAFSSYTINEEEHNKIGEIFSGIKMNIKHKMYVPLLLIRRALFVALLVTLNCLSSKIMIGILTPFQIIYCALIIIIRPFEETKCKMIEIINEVYFTFLLGGLIFFNYEDEWSSVTTYFYMCSIVSNTVVVFIIVFVDFIKSNVMKCRKSAPVSNTENDVSKANILNQSSLDDATPDDTIRARASQAKPQNSNLVADNTEINRENNYAYEESKITLHENMTKVVFTREEL